LRDLTEVSVTLTKDHVILTEVHVILTEVYVTLTKVCVTLTEVYVTQTMGRQSSTPAVSRRDDGAPRGKSARRCVFLASE
jgi:hypothetical protein